MAPHQHVEEEIRKLPDGSRPRATLRMVQLLQEIESRQLKTGLMTNHQYGQIKRYLASFINAKRGTVYRLPTLAEFYARFPELKKRRERIRKFRKLQSKTPTKRTTSRFSRSYKH